MFTFKNPKLKLKFTFFLQLLLQLLLLSPVLLSDLIDDL